MMRSGRGWASMRIVEIVTIGSRPELAHLLGEFRWHRLRSYKDPPASSNMSSTLSQRVRLPATCHHATCGQPPTQTTDYDDPASIGAFVLPRNQVLNYVVPRNGGEEPAESSRRGGSLGRSVGVSRRHTEEFQ
jgi:hypothetical protein